MKRLVGSVMAGVLVLAPVAVVFGDDTSGSPAGAARGEGTGELKGEHKALKGKRGLHKGEYKEDKSSTGLKKARGQYKGEYKEHKGELKLAPSAKGQQKGDLKIDSPTK